MTTVTRARGLKSLEQTPLIFGFEKHIYMELNERYECFNMVLMSEFLNDTRLHSASLTYSVCIFARPLHGLTLQTTSHSQPVRKRLVSGPTLQTETL